MRHATKRRFATTGAIALVLAAAATPVAAIPTYCHWDGGSSGCDVIAYYDESENTTYWDEWCPDGQGWSGEMTGHHIPAACGL